MAVWELYYLSKEPRLSVVIRIAGLQHVGHVARMDEICMPRGLMNIQPEELRKVVRPCMRWRGKVERIQGCWELGVGGQQAWIKESGGNF